MKTIPIKLIDQDVYKIDYLVKIGRYKNRSQAIKTMIDSSLSKEQILLDESDEIPQKDKEKITSYFDGQLDFNFSLDNGKSMADLVSQDRER